MEELHDDAGSGIKGLTMGRRVFIVIAVMTCLYFGITSFTIAVGFYQPSSLSAADNKFELLSPSVNDGANLPYAYTCMAGDGGVSPPLFWRNAPPQTQQFLMTLQTDGFRHEDGEYIGTRCEWTLYAIPYTVTTITAGNTDGVGINGGTSPGVSMHTYNSPCPDSSGNKTYYFTLYALNQDLAAVVTEQLRQGDDTADIGKNMAVVATDANMILGTATLSASFCQFSDDELYCA